MGSPLIGITTYRQSNQGGFPIFSLAEAYVQAITQTGGVPVLIPLGLSESTILDLLPHLDGILFSGGGDVAPDCFDGIPHPEVNFIDIDRDRVEIRLVQEVIKINMPFFGICRGIQVINVALGGTLYTHIPDQLTGAVQHPYIDGNPRDYLAHEVHTKPGSHLARIMGQSSIMVNSMHHQGIARLASGLIPTAFAPDGLMEGVELEGCRFGLGVQWHPECLTQYETMSALFRSFVEAAKK